MSGSPAKPLSSSSCGWTEYLPLAGSYSLVSLTCLQTGHWCQQVVALPLDSQRSTTMEELQVLHLIVDMRETDRLWMVCCRGESVTALKRKMLLAKVKTTPEYANRKASAGRVTILAAACLKPPMPVITSAL